MTEDKSERAQIADRIAAYVRENDLHSPFGGDVYKSQRNGRPFYSVAFSIPRVLDGVVEVWGKTFIRVISRGPAEMPAAVFTSERDALAYLRLGWVEHDRDAAMAIPTK